MEKKEKILFIKEILGIVLISMLGVIGIIFTVLYIDTFSEGIIKEYSSVFLAVCVSIISIITMLTICFFRTSKGFLYKLFLITIAVICVILVFLYVLSASGFLDKIDSVDELRAYISSFGTNAALIFVILQFSQVVFLPLPAFLTVGAGVLLFGALKGSILSCIGIICGSIVAFFIGRVFGYRVAKWLVGKESLDKGLKTIKGKDKVILTFMFLFPFFPDDVLCFVAGITTVSPLFFIIMIFITRIISIVVSCYSMDNAIIPYDTWWGILLWVVFIVLTIFLTIVVYKNGEKIEDFFKKKKKCRKKQTKNK